MDKAALLKDLRKQVTTLEDDLRAYTEPGQRFHAKLKGEYDRARDAQRTALGFGQWRDDRVTQAAVAWILATVFVRFCEDNDLIAEPWIAGPGDRLAEADERHQQFFREYPDKNDRDWLIAAFDHLAATNETVAGLFDRDHNPLWEMEPSYEQAAELLKFWRRLDADGRIVHDFTDKEDLDTRFLGDLYQDLSDHAKKTYALLQTPEFVEEFILDLTLEPAVEEFGLEPPWKHKPSGWPGDEPVVYGLRTIDPACGSGHFLLGIFRRLLDKWEAHAPGLDRWTRIRRVLESVHGCDKNPFAAEIARFRLLVAALHAAGETRLATAPAFPINVAVGDSLLHGRGAAGIQMEFQDVLFNDRETFTYRTEDVAKYITRCDLLGRETYHAVVGNPPYIAVRDKRENENYRLAYDTCVGAYALSVPFVQRFFELALKGSRNDEACGYTGQITSNSFIKRDFGKELVERFLPFVEVSHIIDSSMAYIPGHNREGTPTVILCGRNRPAHSDSSIRVVFSIRGDAAAKGSASSRPVWNAIVNQISQPGSESEWISVDDVSRGQFSSHPWALSGGGTVQLIRQIESAANQVLGDRATEVGAGAITREDSAYLLGRGALRRMGVRESQQRPLVEGDTVRNYVINSPVVALWPYDEESLEANISIASQRTLWPYREILRNRVAFGKTQLARGLTWFEYSMFFVRRFQAPLAIAFAFKASHNHFVLVRKGMVFKQTAPVIILKPGADEIEYFRTFGLLNSSTACFWLRSNSQHQGGGAAAHPWSWTYEFSSSIVKQVPILSDFSGVFGRLLNAHAIRMADSLPSEGIVGEPDQQSELLDRDNLSRARERYIHLRNRIVGIQEELDWCSYNAYGLLDRNNYLKACFRDVQDVPDVRPGERAFEIVLARKVEAGEEASSWFERHGSTPVTKIPERWPEEYRRVVQARIDLIEKLPKGVGLIERPEYKRRWATEPWEKKEKAALRNWILDRCEREDLWFGLRDGFKQPRTLTVNQLADQFKDDADMRSVAALYASDHMKKRDLPLAKVLAEIVADEHVPYLAALRYKDAGLRKREEWEQVWDLQREEDRTGKRLGIAVPPKYAPKDFQKTSYWSQRGKLDVPKERFISYPGASPDADDTLLLGWAGLGPQGPGAGPRQSRQRPGRSRGLGCGEAHAVAGRAA
ncbi:BREX-2 system adenine-specific DNA-methyltransferase PglX [Actinomadura madurae]|nr:BREX-2 system adenine-specific DNA-methyltransferase PglX [Actinomadura madurae]MCP9948342.1 BREX-2 system adenine-specific DNA-methyltransferase PglX [Actinomadura madurae]